MNIFKNRWMFASAVAVCAGLALGGGSALVNSSDAVTAEPNSCGEVLYCVEGGANPWLPYGTNPMVPWGSNPQMPNNPYYGPGY